MLLERGVLGCQPLDGVVGQVELQVADAAEQFADAGALCVDLGVGGLEGVLGVERAFAPGRLCRGDRGDLVLGMLTRRLAAELGDIARSEGRTRAWLLPGGAPAWDRQVADLAPAWAAEPA